LFLIARRLFGLLAGSVAAASYISFAARPGVLGIDGQATHFVNIMALAGILLLLYAMPLRDAGSGVAGDLHHRSRTALLFASGFCFGLSFLMKQPGILFGIFAGAYWLYCERKLPKQQLLIRAAALIAGTLAPYVITCLIMLKAGVFHNFWFW